MTDPDILHLPPPRLDAAISADIVRRLGEAIWRDQWQPRMADALGIERETVSGWRRARRTPSAEQWMTLAAIAREQQACLGLAIALIDRAGLDRP